MDRIRDVLNDARRARFGHEHASIAHTSKSDDHLTTNRGFSATFRRFPVISDPVEKPIRYKAFSEERWKLAEDAGTPNGIRM